MTSSKIKLGLLAQGGQSWIAGRIYCHNLLRAIHSLPENEQSDVCLFDDVSSDLENHKELGEAYPLIETYTNNEVFHRRFQPTEFIRHLTALSWPRNLKTAIRKSQVDIVFPALWSLGADCPAPWIGWIPDFQHKRLPEFFSKDEQSRRDVAFQHLVDKSLFLVVSSQDAYQDLMKWFPMDEKRVGVLPFASVFAESVFESDVSAVLQRYHLPKKFLMFPSQFWKHKNHQVILDAMVTLKAEGCNDIELVSTGHPYDYRFPDHFNNIQKFLNEHQLEERVHILGLIPRVDQLQIVRAAVAIIQPSFFEGWSSLVEDCRSLGKKIYLSDISIHREQNPPRAQFFNPKDSASLVDLLKRDWSHLQPGPVTEDEQSAMTSSKINIQEFGRNFIRIVQRAMKFT